MVIIAASPEVAPVHDRMPALLCAEDIREWMAGTIRLDPPPFAGPLEVTPCASPLASKAKTGPLQGELF